MPSFRVWVKQPLAEAFLTVTRPTLEDARLTAAFLLDQPPANIGLVPFKGGKP